MRRRPRPFELRDGLRTGLRTGCRHAPGRPRLSRRSAADLLPRHLRRLPRREASGRVSGSPLPASELTKTARVGLETTHTYARSLSFKEERSASLAHSPRELGLPSVRRQVFYSKQPHPLPTFATISIFVGAYYTIIVGGAVMGLGDLIDGGGQNLVYYATNLRRETEEQDLKGKKQ